MTRKLSQDQGELRLVPVKPSDDLVAEILYNINRKRANGDDLTAFDVREVVRNLHWNGRYVPKSGAAQPRGMDFLQDLVRELSAEAPADLKAQAVEILRKHLWYDLSDAEIENGSSVFAHEAIAALVAALRIVRFADFDAPTPEAGAA